MKTKLSLWKDAEVKKLFSMVESAKMSGKPLTSVFFEFAKEFQRKPNSVRNYYYAELENLLINSQRATMLGIDTSLHEKKQPETFNESESDNLFKKIEDLKNHGYSVRKACLELASGDITKMVRFQNKYRNILKVKKSITEIKTNIIPIKKKTYLSDEDINSLFLGLVKMVKKNAFEDANSKLKSDAEYANNSLRKALVSLNQKESEIKMLRTKFILLEKEKTKIKSELENLKCTTADLLATKNLEKLEKFVKDKNKSKKETALS